MIYILLYIVMPTYDSLASIFPVLTKSNSIFMKCVMSERE